MCWRIDKKAFKKNPKSYHKIADEDIFVYKYGNVSEEDNCFHPCIKEHFAYKSNVLNKEIKLNLEENKNSILMIYAYYIIEEGYHSYSYSYRKGCHFLSQHIGKFIIPKGTEYYENEDGEVVSSNIIWTGEFKYITDIKTSTEIKLKDLTNVLE